MTYLSLQESKYPGMLKLVCPNDVLFRELVIKAHPSRRWDSFDKAWYVGLSQRERVVGAAKDSGWRIETQDREPYRPYTTRKDLDLPSDLLPYQAEDVTSALRDGVRMLMYDTGCGKSRAAIEILKRIDPAPNRKTLIVAPANVRLNWPKELEKWDYGREYFSIDAGKDLQAEFPPEATIIVSYGMLGALPEDWLYAAIVLDEMHAILDRKSKRSRALDNICKKSCSAMRLGLTATPISANSHNIYNQVNTLVPGYLGTFPQFRDYYFETEGGAHGDYRIITGFKEETAEEFRSHLGAISTRVTKAFLMQQGLLPDWEHFGKRTILFAETGRPTRTIRGWVKEQSRLSKARAKAVAQDEQVLEEVMAAKAAATQEEEEVIFGDDLEPVCIISYLKATAAAIGEELGIQVVTGELTPKKRMGILEDAPAVVCTLASIKEGIDLTRYSRVYLVEPYPVPLFITQVLGRFLRLNSKKGPRFEILGLAGTGDEMILDRLHRRLQEQEMLIKHSTTEEELQKVLTVDVDSDDFLMQMAAEFGSLDWEALEKDDGWDDEDDVPTKKGSGIGE